MIESTVRNYEGLPMFQNIKTVASLLGISTASGYVLMHKKGFSTLQVGSRIVVPRDKLIKWIERQTAV